MYVHEVLTHIILYLYKMGHYFPSNQNAHLGCALKNAHLKIRIDAHRMRIFRCPFFQTGGSVKNAKKMRIGCAFLDAHKSLSI